MIFWIGFGLSLLAFIISFRREKRAFRNAILLALSGGFLFLALTASFESINLLMLGILYGLFPLSLFVISLVFFAAGYITLKKEGFSLAHALPIVFGLGIWLSFGATLYLFSYGSKSFWLLALVILIIMLAAYIIFTFFALLIYSWLYRLLPRGKTVDFILVHGVGLLGGNQVTPLLAGRLDKAIEVYRHFGSQSKIIVSGGQGADETVSEAEAMADYLSQKGIPDEHVLREDQSTTTLENIVYSKKIMEELMPEYRAIFVTSDYHVFRTGLLASQAGLKADGVGSKTAAYYWPNAFIREYIALIIRYRLVPILIVVTWLILTTISYYPSAALK